MKHAIILTTILAAIAIIAMSVSSPVMAHDSLQATKTPTLIVPKTPVKQPALQTSPHSVFPYRSTIMIKDDGTSLPIAVLSSNEPHLLPMTRTLQAVQWSGASLPKDRTFAFPRAARTPQAGELVDNWEQIFNDGFETVFPYTPFCILRDESNDDYDRKWGKDSLYVWGGASAIWPARGGIHGVNPATNFYPQNMDSRLICGPFDIANFQTLMTQFMRWMEIDDPNDKFWWGYSTDGANFYWFEWTGIKNYWVKQSIYLELPAGKSQVWIVLAFTSDWNTPTSGGVWIDDLELWRYKPTVTCGNLDPGNKGVHIPAYEMVFEQWHPIIRAGDVQALQAIMAADARWTRLPFMIPWYRPPGQLPYPAWSAVDPQHYDRMADSLCNAGISTLGLFNHETLTRYVTQANDVNMASSYRQEFVGQATWLAYHFRNRIKYWEVWNEPVVTAELSESHYAALLTQTSSSVKSANPNAKVLFAGLEHAWNSYNNYFAEVYNRLDNEQGRARPFDIFAIHPYRDANYSQAPSVYMVQPDEMPDPSDRTIIDKFVRTMEANGDAGKKVWVTEVGWNSALGEPNAPPLVVDKITQAFYLQKEFDILLDQARSVDRVFWYKYQDEITQMSAPNFNRLMTGEDWRIRHPATEPFDYSAPSVAAPGFWGLYTHIHKLDPKPSRCAFKYYPQRCPDLPWLDFLPLIRRGQ